MWEANPDGGGLAVMCQEKTYVMKGFMKEEEFWDQIKELQHQHLVLHFRWATHGEKIPEFTHPFIVSQDPAFAKTLSIETTRPVLFHNGILSHYGDSKNMSDSLDFVTSSLSRMRNLKSMVKLLHSVGSKYVLIGNKLYWEIGHFEKHKGLSVSNTTFDRVTYVGCYSSRDETGRFSHGNNVYPRKERGSGKDWRDRDSLLTVCTPSSEKGEDSIPVVEGDKKPVEAEASGSVLEGSNANDSKIIEMG